ncbi:MAG: hypothetical protein WCP17_02900 [bacterium]
MNFFNLFGVVGNILVVVAVVAILFLVFARRDAKDRIVVVLTAKLAFWRLAYAAGQAVNSKRLHASLQRKVWRAEMHAGVKFKNPEPTRLHRWSSRELP